MGWDGMGVVLLGLRQGRNIFVGVGWNESHHPVTD